MTEPTRTGGAGQRYGTFRRQERIIEERVSEPETELEANEERITEFEAKLDRLNAR